MTGVAILPAVARPFQTPEHPAVDWSTLEDGRVDVACPDCGKVRRRAAAGVTQYIRMGLLTGRCRSCSKRRPRPNPVRDSYLRERLRRGCPPSPVPHPAVDWDRLVATERRWEVPVTCPDCGLERFVSVTYVKTAVAAGHFTGSCGCRRRTPWLLRRLGISDLADLPQHPAVDWTTLERRDGLYRVRVTCQFCGEQFWPRYDSVLARMRSGTFRGVCQAHSGATYWPRRSAAGAATLDA